MDPRTKAGCGRWLIILLLAVAGCGRGVQPAGGQAGEQVIGLHIVQGPGGATLALVPVFIQDQGPFTFALDTGASSSVVDRDIAAQLNLPVVDTPVEITGVTATSEARLVQVSTWRVGQMSLPKALLASLEMPVHNKRHGLQGLLGSDILSRFGAITVDYERQVLVLRRTP